MYKVGGKTCRDIHPNQITKNGMKAVVGKGRGLGTARSRTPSPHTRSASTDRYTTVPVSEWFASMHVLWSDTGHTDSKAAEPHLQPRTLTWTLVNQATRRGRPWYLPHWGAMSPSSALCGVPGWSAPQNLPRNPPANMHRRAVARTWVMLHRAVWCVCGAVGTTYPRFGQHPWSSSHLVVPGNTDLDRSVRVPSSRGVMHCCHVTHLVSCSGPRHVCHTWPSDRMRATCLAHAPSCVNAKSTPVCKMFQKQSSKEQRTAWRTKARRFGAHGCRHTAGKVCRSQHTHPGTHTQLGGSTCTWDQVLSHRVHKGNKLGTPLGTVCGA